MKTNIGIETSDEQRLNIGKRLGHDRMVSRKELREEVERHVYLLGSDAEIISVASEKTQEAPREETTTGRDSSISGFVPSRGDEDYLTQPKDKDIAAACSRILDDAALIEQFAWDTIERNRK